MTKKQKKLLFRIVLSAVLFIAVFVTEKLTVFDRYIYLLLYLVPFFAAGYDVLLKSGRNIVHGQVFDEAFLMSVATVGALAIGEYHESVFVMVFYQIGELFQSIAVGKSRRSISALMDIRPDSATVLRGGEECEVFPEEVEVGETVLVRPGERIPLDGVVLSGVSAVDTSALTGESVPADVKEGDTLVSGSINLTGNLTFRAEKEYGESTVAKILELVENSGFNKAKSEQFLTRFARYYTPAVVISAVLLALIPSLITHNVTEWVSRALIFLVVSCPCAIVISVPLSFFGGIGGASAKGVLIKGANYLEALADVKTVVFDKTGTLTTGSFSVTQLLPSDGTDEKTLLRTAASAEYYSLHPIALSVREAVGDCEVPEKTEEKAGFGVRAELNGSVILAGKRAYLTENGIEAEELTAPGTVISVAKDGKYLGSIVLGDTLKPTAKAAISSLREAGVTKTVMLTGDREAAAADAAEKLGIDEYASGLLPADKVEKVAELCGKAAKKEKVLFVGDGINDAPVLTRADIGIAMGALGSDAAIEAADAVIMDDDPGKLVTAVKIARKTRRIVRQNVTFALGIKFGVLIFASFGLTNMWVGVLADVGVAVIAILNAMRTLGKK